VLWMALITACAGEGGVRPVPRDTGLGTEVVDRIVQVSELAADVLFVIDDSGSMKDDQTALALELPRFVSTLEEWGVDYHVGVVTTDTEDDATRGRLVGNGAARFVTPEVADPVATLAELVQVGTQGAGVERGLLAAWLTLEAQRNIEENRGFARPGVALSTVVISDEDDESDSELTVGEFVDWYRGLREDPADVSFSAVVALQSVGRSSRGRRYLSVASQVGGVVMDINAGQWDKVLDGLGLRAAGLRSEFVLSRIPIADTLDVTLERRVGEELQVIEVASFRYEPLRNAVAIYRVPEALDTVVIRYRTAD